MHISQNVKVGGHSSLRWSGSHICIIIINPTSSSSTLNATPSETPRSWRNIKSKRRWWTRRNVSTSWWRWNDRGRFSYRKRSRDTRKRRDMSKCLYKTHPESKEASQNSSRSCSHLESSFREHNAFLKRTIQQAWDFSGFFFIFFYKSLFTSKHFL